MPHDTPLDLEPVRKTAERFDVCVKTIDRWSEDGILPPPVRINNRKYLPKNVEPRRDATA